MSRLYLRINNFHIHAVTLILYQMYLIKSTSSCLYVIGFIHLYVFAGKNLFFKFFSVAFFVFFFYQTLEDLKQNFTSFMCLTIWFSLYLKKWRNLIGLMFFFLSNTDLVVSCQSTFAKLRFVILKIIINWQLAQIKVWVTTSEIIISEFTWNKK